MNKYDIGYSDGYCGILVRYPDKKEYMNGYHAGYAAEERNYYATLRDDNLLPSGANDMNQDYFYA